jgi:hypothetical protein
MQEVTVRQENQADADAIAVVNQCAFGGEAEAQLVAAVAPWMAAVYYATRRSLPSYSNNRARNCFTRSPSFIRTWHAASSYSHRR